MMSFRLLCATLALATAAGCGRSRPAEQEEGMKVEILEEEDTTGLSEGRAILRQFEVERDPAGAIRARGRIALPEGTRLELALYPRTGNDVLARTQFDVRDGGFEAPPLLASQAPLPQGTYRVRLVAYFDPALQPAEVMEATDEGRRLRGPGMTRGRNGLVAFHHAEERRL